MNTPMRSVAPCVAALLPLLLCLQGCSLIGLGIGAVSDSSLPDTTRVTSWGIDTVEVGTDVTLLLKDGSSLKGEFAGVELDSLDQYTARYDKYLATYGGTSLLPPPGDRVFTVFAGGVQKSQPRVVAYSYNGMYFLLSSNRMPLIRYADIDTLLYKEKIWSGKYLRQAAGDQHRSRLNQLSGSGSRFFPDGRVRTYARASQK